MEGIQKVVWEEFPEGCPFVEFRLVYEGPLKAIRGGSGGGRVHEKHAIRKLIHKQIKRLWEVAPHLKMRTDLHSILNAGHFTRLGTGVVAAMPHIERRDSLCKELGDSFSRCGYKFVPLVSNRLKLACGLDILFLRRDMPNTPLIRSGGDIDNRLKVLFDALRIPENCDELAGAVKDPGEDPYFFCLLEDDALITDVTVTTDTLLTPCQAGEETDVHLIIKAKVRPTDFSFENLDFVS